MIKTPTKTTKNVKNVKPTVEEIYTSMTDHEHILKRPGMWIGGIQEDDVKKWVFDEEQNRIVFKTIKYIPGLYKIVDEILVNARDQRVKDPTCDEIRVVIDEETGTIFVWNNGDDGIPIEWHKVENCYVPEFIFGKLRSSSHYGEEDKDVKKVVGGQNGIGSKAVSIYSIHFIVEVVDGARNLKFIQHFYDNMYRRDEPIIEKLKGKHKSYTKITFTPDYKRFGVDKLSDGMVGLLKKRVYDIAAVTNVKVSLNDKHIDIKDFNDYVKLFYEDGEVPNEPIYEVVNDYWKVAVVYDPNSGYRQISYVNGICTFQGGSHVEHVLDQVVGKLYDQIMEKNKTLKLKKNIIKDNLTFFIDSMIDRPEFSSQSKEFLTTKVANFGSRCDISPDFIKKLSKTGIVDEVVNFAKFRALEDLKKTDGKKKESVKGLAKLVDAHNAGTRNGYLSTLILTEGDSAKPFGVAGLEVVGKNNFGVFPLKGKLLNVREATPKQLLENEEIKNIKKIMGLKQNKKYTSVKELRYGRILILTDQDYDGSHIKGLIMNFIHYFWPSLLNIPGFITTLKTPIVKVFKKTDIKKKNGIIFYTITEYQEWKDKIGDNIKLYNPKYYKGLGTSTDEEAKEAFTDFESKVIEYVWDIKTDNNNTDNNNTNNNNTNNNKAENIGSSADTEIDIDNDADTDTDTDDWDEADKAHECYDAITLAFAKGRANDRKKWLGGYSKDIILEKSAQQVTYYDFVHRDLIHFSNYDNERSIPSVCDGFKPSLRKILFGSILRKIFKEEIRVSQLSGFVSDKSGYHHGEMSLQGAITGMAQNFMGSNNINWLLPIGNFGNRMTGGKNASSARYIYTQLNELVQLAFRDEDNCVLNYVDDDGLIVEPHVYAPIICQLLINGIEGIGTGYSTDIPAFNPKDVFRNIRLLIEGKQPIPMTPYFKGFTGATTKVNDKVFETHGKYEIINENTIIIEELPVGTWTENYKAFLDSLTVDDIKKPLKGQILKNSIDDCGNSTIKFTLIFMDGVLQDMIKKNEIEKRLKLVNRHNLSNMHAYDVNDKIKKYDSPLEILTDYYGFRLEMYDTRKKYYTKILENKLNIIGWKIKFIDYVISEKIVVFENKKAKSKQFVIDQLIKLGFPELSANIEALDEKKSYNYLTNITIFDLTDEERDKLKEDYTQKLDELNLYKNTTIQEIWMSELNEFENAYDKWLMDQSDESLTGKKQIKGKGKRGVKGAMRGRGLKVITA